MRPARNAPSASDSPALCVNQAASSVSSSTVSVKNSRERASATSWKIGRSHMRPTNRIAASTNALLASAQPSAASADCSPLPASAGMTIRNGTTTRS